MFGDKANGPGLSARPLQGARGRWCEFGGVTQYVELAPQDLGWPMGFTEEKWRSQAES